MTDHTDLPTDVLLPPVPAQRTIADDIEHRFDPRTVIAKRLAGGIWVAALGTVTLVGMLLLLFLARPPFGVALALITVWVVVSSLIASLVWFGPAIRFKHASYRVSARGVQVRDGIFWRSVVNVPRSRVQHTDVSQGPIDRSFGLASLTIHTAGTQHASVPVSGLPLEVANQIRDLLIEGGQDDAV